MTKNHHHPEPSDELIRIGKLGKTHGLDGALRLYSLSDVPNRFERLQEVLWVSPKGDRKRLRVVDIRPAERFFLVRFQDFDTPEKARNLINGHLAVPKSERGTLPPGRYFIDDIIGIQVVDDQGQLLGKVTEVWQPGPHDIFEIHGPLGELMVPVIDEAIRSIDVAQKRMIIKKHGPYDHA